MYHYGVADDSGNTEDDFMAWKMDLWKHVYKALPDVVGEEGPAPKEPAKQGKFELKGLGEGESMSAKDHPRDFGFQRFADSAQGTVASVREMRQSATEALSTLELLISLPPEAPYRTAQNVLLFPRNTQGTVDKVLEYLGCLGAASTRSVEFGSWLSAEERLQTPLSFPLGRPLRTIVSEHLDIKGALKSANEKVDSEANS